MAARRGTCDGASFIISLAGAAAWPLAARANSASGCAASARPWYFACRRSGRQAEQTPSSKACRNEAVRRPKGRIDYRWGLAIRPAAQIRGGSVALAPDVILPEAPAVTKTLYCRMPYHDRVLDVRRPNRRNFGVTPRQRSIDAPGHRRAIVRLAEETNCPRIQPRVRTLTSG